jgi:hypothetical protein
MKRGTVENLLDTTEPWEDYLQLASLASILLCIVLWIRAKTVDQTERDHAENRALFVGLWPAVLWLLANRVASGPWRA